jgi:hypothetical protein
MHTTRELYHYERLVELYTYILASLADASNWRRCRPPKTATLQLCNANTPTHPVANKVPKDGHKDEDQNNLIANKILPKPAVCL